MVLLYLISGLFLGWSLGANDAANVFGTAVSTKMIRYRTAAICAGLFVVLGAYFSGSGTSGTLEQLGAVNELAGAFVVALAAACAVYLMIMVGYPVSTSQAIVGAIVAWNIFSGKPTNTVIFGQIVVTWVVCPVLAAIFAIIIYKVVTWLIRVIRPSHFGLDRNLRWGLLIVGILGSYSLGANNVANVVGVFIPSLNMPYVTLPWLGTFSDTEILFLAGGLSIALGILTYSRRVMETVGKGIMPLTPVAAFVAVLAHSIVLFVFASQSLSNFVVSLGLPEIPLVPVSSSQAIIGAVVGIGLLRGSHVIKWRMLGKIASGWVTTPIIAGVICFCFLYIMQNIIGVKVYF